MNKNNAILAFFLPLLIITSNSLAQPSKQGKEELNCATLYKETQTLNQNDFYGKIPRAFSAPFQDTEYESKKAFVARVAAARKEHESRTAKQMENKVLYFKLIDGEYFIKYQPDRGGFEAKFGVSAAKTRKDGDAVPFPVVTVSTSENTKSLGLGATKSYSKQIGMAFVKNSLSSPFLAGKKSEFFFKFPVEEARAVGRNARFVFIGRLQAPWSFSTSSSSTDYGKLQDQVLSTDYAAVNLVCAAIVDQTNSKILYEFK